MMLRRGKIYLLSLCVTLAGCSFFWGPEEKSSTVKLVMTPLAAYTTAKGRYLGEKYQRNLDSLVEQIVRNPVTGQLQFANNIVAVGGIGFFTHSAVRAADERYLEVILSAPDILDEKMDFSSKIDRLFSQYGSDILSILSGDREIYGDADVAGYGLNLSWRNSFQTPSGPRGMIEAGVIYISKEQARTFLARQISRESLLGGAVIFALQGESPARLARYLPPIPKAEAEMAAKTDPGRRGSQPSGPEEKSLPPLLPQKEEPSERQIKQRPGPEGVRGGYIVQLTIPDTATAERLSESLKGQGYTTLMSATEESEAARLRVGSFPSHAQAKKFLERLRQEGVSGGLVLQVPR